MQHADWEEYDAVLHLIYAAAIQPELWPEALKRIAELWGASKAILFSFSVPDGKVLFNIAHNLSTRGLQIYATRTAVTDPFLEKAFQLGLAGEGNVTIGESHVSRAELLKTDFYKQLWEPENIGQTCYAVVFDGTDSMKAPVVLSLMRSLDEPVFVEVERAMLQRMQTHLSRAIGVMFHLRNVEFQIAATRSAFDTLSSGVFLLNEDLEITFENRAAKKLMAEAITLEYELLPCKSGVAHGLTLAPAYRRQQAAFERMLQMAGRSRICDEVDHFSDALIIADNAGDRPQCVIHSAPLVLPDAARATFGAPILIIFVYNLQSIKIDPQLLEKLFGLTPGEIRASTETLQGGTAEEMARRLKISVHTFKSQLKLAYEKTNTHRQADFLKLLLALASSEGGSNFM